MNTIKSLLLISLVPFCVATAGDKEREQEQQQWMKESMMKERERANENMKSFSNTARFEEKFGWAKEKQPEHYAAFMAANKKASESWAALLQKAESATNPDALSEAKQAANEASANAYLAEMTLKYAGAASERKSMMEKTRDRDVGSLAAKLDANEKSLLLANRAKNEAQVAIEKLQLENKTLNNALREAYDGARKKEHDKDDDKDREKDRDKDREKDRDKDKEHEKHEQDKPKNPGGGGGVLGN